MFEPGSMFGSLIFGSIGAGYFMYGKSQQHVVALGAGVALCLIPYIATTLSTMVPVSALVMAVPLVWRIE
jgi:hypothetical protein